MFILDKYCPKTFDKSVINKKIIGKLKNLNVINMMNVLFYGINGTGKYILSQLLLNNIYGDEIYKLIRIMEEQVLISLTNESAFTGFVEKELYKLIETQKCKLVAGSVFGYFDKHGEYVSISKLMSDERIELDEKNLGIDIPIDTIIKRKNYDWLSKLNLDDLPKVNNNIGYLLNKIYC